MKNTRLPMMLLLIALAASSQGCLGLARKDVLPDRTIPHTLSHDQKIDVWARQNDGSYVEETWNVPAGFVLFAPELVGK